MYSLLKNRSVLYIEDDRDVLENIAAILQNYFQSVYTADTAEKGLVLFEKREPEVILVDIELPGMNGIDLIKRIKTINDDVTIAIISAYTKTDYLLESVELHLLKYIVKPFTSNKIHMLLEKLEKEFKTKDLLQLSPGVELNLHTASVTYDTEIFMLTPKEMQFLTMLQRNHFVHYGELGTLWQQEAPSESAVRSFIKTLRKKLPSGLLKNKQNFGYYIED